MHLIRSITRFVPQYSVHEQPSALEVTVSLVAAGDRFFISTPWSMTDATDGADTSDATMEGRLGRDRAFGTAAEALAAAKLLAPHAGKKNNEIVRERLHDAIRWDGDIVGRGLLADALDVSTDRLMRLAWGGDRATARMAQAALAYHGRPL
jgi:hypothetical protein